MPAEALLTVLGSGTLLPSTDRGCASYHLGLHARTAEGPGPGGRSGAGGQGSGGGVLVDCGTGALHALGVRGVDWRGIGTVCITHYHTDHVGDLAALLAAFRFVGRTRPLRILGPADLADFLGRLSAAFGPWIVDPPYPLEVVALGPGGVWTSPDGTLTVSACPTPHTDTSLAYRLSGPWGALGYTGDTGPSAAVADHLARCDALIAECSHGDPPETDRHLSPTSLAALARRARPGLLLVTHVYPPHTAEEMQRAVSTDFTGRVVAALDGMRVRVAPGRAAVDRETGPL